MAVWNGVQAGTISYIDLNSQIQAHAGYWQDSGASFVDLHPAGQRVSYAFGVYQANVVGSVGSSTLRPALWNNLPTNSYVDLTPLNATGGQAFGMFGTKQVGEVDIAGGNHAALWNGTPQSFIDLDVGTGLSFAVAVSGNGVVTTEAGWVAYGQAGVHHAAFWSGSAGSYVDLQSFLPAGFVSSEATGIWVNNAGVSFISGFAVDEAGHTNAMLWTQTVPEPTTLLAAIGVTTGALARRRR